MANHWSFDAVFYHIYPLGMLAAPQRNDFSSPPVARLEQLYDWLDHIQALGANALYLGPLFESSEHGYDTVDYYHVDRRLGDNETLARLSAEVHRRGMRLILDGVFNHVGRDFWAFYDLRQKGEKSAYREWFKGLCFGETSPYGDPFRYEGWSGHYSLVKLDVLHPAVKEHLLGAVQSWVEQFDIDGLRLDAADCIAPQFLGELADFARNLRPDFWLMGEVVHGDYSRWANPGMLDSVTNYEGYKGLYSSLNDRNYFEIAYSLTRQFGKDGLYRGLPLYNFVDNHDVDRAASILRDPAQLFPLYCLLFTMPGVPSIYYGSEWGIHGRRTNHSDSALRPALQPGLFAGGENAQQLFAAIQRLARLRKGTPALKYGSYREQYINHEQLAFVRETDQQQVLVVVNASSQPSSLNLSVPWQGCSELVDLLNPLDRFPVREGKVEIDPVPPLWARVLSAHLPAE